MDEDFDQRPLVNHVERLPRERAMPSQGSD